jgi:glycerol-3-phosphate dehydrogenase
MADSLGWSSERRDDEIERTLTTLRDAHGVEVASQHVPVAAPATAAAE